MTFAQWRNLKRAFLPFVVAAVWAPGLGAQTSLYWEPYVKYPTDGSSAPSFASDGRMWYAGTVNDTSGQFISEGLVSLGHPFGMDRDWDYVTSSFSINIWEGAYAISPDTLLARGQGLYRSLDAGTTWRRLDPQPNPYPRVSQWLEIPPGVPRAGRILGAAEIFMAIYSDNRGASFQTATAPGSSAEDAQAIRLAIVTAGPSTGRVLAAGLSGITKSDDGGQTWTKTPEWAYFAMSSNCIGRLRGQAPGGGDRVVTVLNDIRISDDSIRVSVSDDGGDTWRRPRALLPGNFRTCVELVDLGGGRAVAVMLRGPVYGTEDAGETWEKWSEWPGETGPNGSAGRASWAVLGPDGHLYIGIYYGSAPNAYDVRTTAPIGMITAGEPPPAGPSGLALSVRPNPSDGRVTVLLEAAEPTTVRLSVVDALGREVALLFDGPVTERREVPVETSGLAPGVYVVRASTAGFADVTSRFTVAR